MTEIPTGLAINTATAADRTTASGFRQVMAALLRQSVAGVPVSGVVYAPGSPLDVTLDAGMNYNVAAGFAVMTRTGQGAYLAGTVDDVVVSTSAADGSNPRYDRIYIVQPDPELSDSGHARIDVVEGTPAGSPSLPALPAGALELGRVLLPAGAAGTDEAASVTNKATVVGLNTHWSMLQGVPTTFAPASHTLDSHTGTLALAKGGTGQTTKAAARAALGVNVITDGASTPGGLAVGDLVIRYTPA